jgi:succinate-semialdehyde dehydrogenase/glutarate-semialdehyde dehydrogenase
MGSGFDKRTTQGLLVNKAAVEKILKHVQDAVEKGAKVEIGGKSPNMAGFFFEPTVLSGVSTQNESRQRRDFWAIGTYVCI